MPDFHVYSLSYCEHYTIQKFDFKANDDIINMVKQLKKRMETFRKQLVI